MEYRYTYQQKWRYIFTGDALAEPMIICSVHTTNVYQLLFSPQYSSSTKAV